MPGPSRPSAQASVVSIVQRAEVVLTLDELARAAGISEGTMARLVRLGLVAPTAPGAHTFTASTAARLRRMLRLRTDLGVNLTGAAIILDLLDRLESVQAELARARGGS
jgi:chaperone modulatory protein CbpM